MSSNYEEAADIQLQLQKQLVLFRFFYVPLAFLFGILTFTNLLGVEAKSFIAAAVSLLVVVLLANALLMFLLRRGASGHLAVWQIILDLLFFVANSYFMGWDIFFFIPIIAALFLFGFRGGIIVAGLTGALFVSYQAWFFSDTLNTGTLLGMFATFATYFFLAFFCASLLNMVRRRDVNLLEQITEVVHQLRTPLSATKWTIKILLDEDAGKNTKEQRDLLLKGFASNERMVTLVNDVLAVSRLEAGKFKYRFVPVQFEELAQEVIKSIVPVAAPRDIHIEFIAPKEQLPKWKMDPDHIKDVLQNLLDNAIKYTKEGGVITVGVAKEGNNLHFFVKDNGIGVPDEAKGKIFSRFYRAPNAIYTETNGSGLGLFIAQSIVRRHGGKIWFENVIGGGTNFHVTIPGGM